MIPAGNKSFNPHLVVIPDPTPPHHDTEFLLLNSDEFLLLDGESFDLLG